MTQRKTVANTSILARVFGIGLYFGIVLVKTDVARWERIHKMFLFQEAYMYLLLTTALVVGITTVSLLRYKGQKTIDGDPIYYTPKPLDKGVIIGGLLFGVGWGLIGSCPGPIYAQIGTGSWRAILSLIFALLGMYLYAYLRPKLPH